ncbi:MAG: hypothetical protein HY578_06540 [Nitrospinae bacterium]|nr:hypothetical protein [Nitrospinota bacterium]
MKSFKGYFKNICLVSFLPLLIFDKTLALIHDDVVMKENIRKVYQNEQQYLKARVSNDLHLLYSFQHPEYKNIISLEKFLTTGGYPKLDYFSVTEQNQKPQVYIQFRQFHFILHDIKIEKSFIDKDGRYAKFHIIHIMDIFLPIARGIPIRREMKSIDYWEKLDGNWFILNKVRLDPFAHISGAITKNPTAFPEEDADYIEILAGEIDNEKKDGE